MFLFVIFIIKKINIGIYRLTPGLLRNIAKYENPWPNVEASCGAILYCFGIKEEEFFSTIFGVARSIGVCSNLVLARAFGLPIERPGSMTLEMLENVGKKKSVILNQK